MNYRSRNYVDLHVIDAIEEGILKSGYSEALMLRYYLKETNIHIVSHLAWDMKSLCRVITAIANYRPQYCAPRRAIPYLHLSCHGTKTGLYLGDSPLTSWEVLSDCLLPLQQLTDYNLPLSLSSCWGFYGAQLAYAISQKYKKPRPYHSLVGPMTQKGIGELCEAFGIFYCNLLVRHKSIKQAVAIANQQGKIDLNFTFGSEVVR